MGTPDQRTGNISGSGALQSWPFRQSQWTALVELHGAHPGVMDLPDQGVAGPDVARAFGAIEPSARLSPQAADGLGPARRVATVSLAARSSGHFHRRQQLR